MCICLLAWNDEKSFSGWAFFSALCLWQFLTSFHGYGNCLLGVVKRVLQISTCPFSPHSQWLQNGHWQVSPIHCTSRHPKTSTFLTLLVVAQRKANQHTPHIQSSSSRRCAISSALKDPSEFSIWLMRSAKSPKFTRCLEEHVIQLQFPIAQNIAFGALSCLLSYERKYRTVT